jgi:hypothetical protein
MLSKTKLLIRISHCNYEVINNELECMWREMIKAVVKKHSFSDEHVYSRKA